MNTKILASVMVIALVGAVAGAGTFAYFSDTETSTGNMFTSGTLNLKLSNDGETYLNGVTTTWESPDNWAPGQEFDERLELKNTGNVDGKLVLLDFKTGENWDQDFAEKINVEIREFQGDGSWYDFGTLADMMNIDFGDLGDTKWDLILFKEYEEVGDNGLDPKDEYSGDYLPADSEGWIDLRFEFDSSAGNDLQDAETMFDVEVATLQHDGPIKRGELATGDVSDGWTTEE